MGSYEAGQADRGSSFVFVQLMPNSAYLTPCPPFTWTEQRLDVHVIAAVAIVVHDRVPPSYPKNPTGNFHAVISGRIFEQTPDGSQAVAGAIIVSSSGGEMRSNTSGRLHCARWGTRGHRDCDRA